MINYAHRGASEYAPENTMAAFCLAVEMGANGIETDVRLSKDGVPVLFHDDDMARISSYRGAVESLEYKQLSELDLGSWKHSMYKNERIVRLDDFLRYFSRENLAFALELKGAGSEEKTVEYVHLYDCSQTVTITSFDFDMLKKTGAIDEGLARGYLTGGINDETLSVLEAEGIGEICPNAQTVTKRTVEYARKRGFSVRAWGVGDITLMKRCCEAGVDGMTVNFPDKLAEWIKKPETHG